MYPSKAQEAATLGQKLQTPRGCVPLSFVHHAHFLLPGSTLAALYILPRCPRLSGPSSETPSECLLQPSHHPPQREPSSPPAVRAPTLGDSKPQAPFPWCVSSVSQPTVDPLGEKSGYLCSCYQCGPNTE